MLHWIGLPPGTVAQWGSFLSLLAILAGALTVYIRGMPDRLRAGNERRQIDIKESEAIRDEYAEQIKVFRAEVHGYRNELAAVQASLARSESTSRQRSDRINNMMFIIRLLISELERLDSGSIIVKQAKAMLAQMEPHDHKSSALEAAEHTLVAAKETVAEVKQSDGGK